MRFDLSVIASWIEPESRVLDLGCGKGDLLLHLKSEKRVKGIGVEMDEEKAARAIEQGASVIHGDIYEEIGDYPDASFDYVILSQTLMQVFDPEALIREMFRVAGRGIVSFPNFAHVSGRFQLFFNGRAPVTKELPYEWYDTPNIRVIPIKDFRRFVDKMGLAIEREVAIRTHHHDESGKIVRVLPNLLATYGVFMLATADER